MRVIGYCNTLVESFDQNTDFTETVVSFANQNKHQITSIVQDNLSSMGPTPEFSALIRTVEKDPAGFLIVIPDARHIGLDLESVARSVISVE